MILFLHGCCFAANLAIETKLSEEKSVLLLHLRLSNFKNNLYYILVQYNVIFHDIKFVCLFVLRFYGPVNPMGHVERGQFT